MMSFEHFWSIYPRRIAKFKARTAWDKALKFSSEEEILDGARRYAIERQDEDQQYTKHPATWLNGGCWMDDPGSNRTGSDRMGVMNLASELRESNGRKYEYSTPDFFADASPQPRSSRHH